MDAAELVLDAAELVLVAAGVCAIAVALGMAFSNRRGRTIMMGVGRVLVALLPPW